jgi:hypothetical protein
MSFPEPIACLSLSRVDPQPGAAATKGAIMADLTGTNGNDRIVGTP